MKLKFKNINMVHMDDKTISDCVVRCNFKFKYWPESTLHLKTSALLFIKFK
jgi:hypothetical protein